MNIVIIGNFDSIYMYEYVKEVLWSENFNVGKKYYFIHDGNKIRKEYSDFYEGHAERIFYVKSEASVKKMLDSALREIENIDVLHIHYIKLWYYHAIKKMRKSIKKIILTAWGSDLLRLNSRYYYKMKKFMRIANYIVVGSENLREFVTNKISSDYKSKIVWARFGTPVIDEIAKLKEEYIEKSNGITIPSDKFIIACGYNGKREQQHEEIIQALTALKDCYRNKIFLHFPMGYGLNEEYYAYISDMLEQSGFEYKIDKKFYSPEKIAKIRLLADIFIHGQITDASSSSVFEYIYADTILINGDWLYYEDLEKYQIPYLKYKKFSELPGIIENVIDSYDDLIKELREKNGLIRETRSWEKLHRRWQALY